MADLVNVPDLVAPKPEVRAGRGVGISRARSLLGTVPFFAYVTIFLIIPTLVVVIGAFAGDSGGVTLSNVSRADRGLHPGRVRPQHRALRGHRGDRRGARGPAGVRAGHREAERRSAPGGHRRRPACSRSSAASRWRSRSSPPSACPASSPCSCATTSASTSTPSGVWLFELPGLILVYTYFQIPLMVIVFLPALDGIRPQWREATESLGGSTWQYWTPGRRAAAGPGLPRLDAAAVRQRLLRVRDRGRPGQPGQPDHPAADPQRPDQRGGAGPAEPGQGDGARHGRRGGRGDDAVRAAAAEDVTMAGLIARRARKQRAFRWVVLIVLGIFFLLPMVAMVEFTTRGDQGTWRLLVNWPQLSETYPDLAAGHRRVARAGGAHRAADAGAAGADRDLGPAAAARAAPARRVHLPAAADHPGDRAGGRPGPGVRVGQLLPRRLVADADLRVHRAGPALCLPRDRRRPVRDRRAHAGRGGPQPRRELGHRDVAGGAAEHPLGGAVRGVPDRGAGARRVHHRVPAEPHQPAGRDQLPGQEQRHHVGGRVAGRAAARVRAAAAAVPARRPTTGRPTARAQEDRGPESDERRRRPPRRPAPHVRQRARPRRPRPRTAARRADRPARAVRLRQDHRAAGAGRAGGRGQRPGGGRRQGHHRRCRPTAATWAWCSRRTACSRI